MLPPLPYSNCALLIRTDFTDDSIWRQVCQAAAAPSREGFTAGLEFVDDRGFEDLPIDRAASMPLAGPITSFVFLVDQVTIGHPDHPILVVDRNDRPSRLFRVVPGAMWSVENNLSIANMDFEDFTSSVDPEGIFRGF